MKEVLKISYFEKEIKSFLNGFDVQYFSYSSGSFGSHEKVVFTKNNIEGYIDFYEFDWVEIHIFDFEKESIITHVLMNSEWDRASKEEKIKEAVLSLVE